MHPADAPPTRGNVLGGHNAYDYEYGFMTGFNSDFINSLLNTTLITAKADIDGGGTESLIDKIFLASKTEVNSGNEVSEPEGRRIALFSDNTSKLAYPTGDAVSKSTYPSSDLNTSLPWMYWLRTPYSPSSCHLQDVHSSGDTHQAAAGFGDKGIRPFCNLPNDTYVNPVPNSDGSYNIIF